MIFGFRFDPDGTVKKHIENWKPRNCKTEKDYEKSLARKLDKELKNQKIETQYGTGKYRIDIVVDSKVPVEIKNDLKTTSGLQRVIGQLDSLYKHFTSVILVICGEVKSDYIKDLEKYAEDKMTMTMVNPLHIIVKGKVIK